MSQSSGSPERGDVTWPDSDPWADPAGPPPAGAPPAGAPPAGWPPGGAPPPTGYGQRARRFNPVILIAMALLGLALGVGIALVARGPSASGGQPSAAGLGSSLQPSSPSNGAPSGTPSGRPGQSSGGLLPGGSGALPGSGSGAAPGNSAGGSGFRMLFLGKITALSKGSVTLSAAGHTVTAALTGSSKITGHLKVGNTVSAQIGQESGGKYVVTAIQDPPSVP